MRERTNINQISWAWVGRSSSPVVKKHQYTALELLKHLCEVVIPLQDVKEVPNQAPIKLPAWLDSFMLETKLADLIELDDRAMAREERIRLNAMLEQDQRENSGFGDQLMEIQQTSWAVVKICMGSFKIEMCSSYGDEDRGNFAMVSRDCCQGTERGKQLCDCGNQMGQRMLGRGRQGNNMG